MKRVTWYVLGVCDLHFDKCAHRRMWLPLFGLLVYWFLLGFFGIFSSFFGFFFVYTTQRTGKECMLRPSLPNECVFQTDVAAVSNSLRIELDARTSISDTTFSIDKLACHNTILRLYAYVHTRLISYGRTLTSGLSITVNDVVVLVFMSRSPLCKQASIDFFRTLSSTDPFREIFLDCCIFARGILPPSLVLANDHDWDMWIESL